VRAPHLAIVCILLAIPQARGSNDGASSLLHVAGTFVLVSDARPIPVSFDCHDVVVVVSGARSLRDNLIITDERGDELARPALFDERVRIYGNVCAPMASFAADLARSAKYSARGTAIGNALHPATISFEELKAAGYIWTIEV
jgi:hypothetical protein